MSSLVEAGRKAQARSRVTNGATLLPGVDGRSAWVRRCKDIIELHLSDLGGDTVVSEAERSIVRRAATLTIECERLEAQFAEGKASIEAVALYVTASNTLLRLLVGVGLRRRARDVTPTTLDQILREDRS